MLLNSKKSAVGFRSDFGRKVVCYVMRCVVLNDVSDVLRKEICLNLKTH